MRARPHKGLLYSSRLPDPAAILPDARRGHPPPRRPAPAGRVLVAMAFSSLLLDLSERPGAEWSRSLQSLLVIGGRGEVLLPVAVDVRDTHAPETPADRGGRSR